MTLKRPNAPAKLGVRSSHALRGRSTESGIALDTLRTVQRGRPAVLVVSGEPGIGKTALLNNVVEQAGRLGFRTAQSSAHADDRISALSSLGPALRFGTAPLIDSADFMDLAGLLEQPLWFAEKLATLLEQGAQEGPVLIALDDAQWCDPLTTFTLSVLPKRLLATPMAWVVATRPVPGGGPAEHIADAAEPELSVASLQLGPLSEAAVFAVAADRLGAAPDSAVLRRLVKARGNPFLTVQLLEGMFGSPESGSAISSGLLEDVRRRLAGRSEQCRQLVRTAAVVGPSCLLSDVASLTGAPTTATLTAPLIEAIEAGLLVDDGVSIQFRHELLRDAVYEDLPPSGRRAVHRAFADLVLEEGRGYAVAAPHVIASATEQDAGVAAQVLRKAAHEVVDTMAVTSVSFIRQAWDLIGRDDPQWAEIGVDVVEILGAARQFTDATKAADLLLDARIPAELHGRARLILLPRLWATEQLVELRERTRQPSGVPAIDARFEAYRALAEGTEAPVSDDPIAAVLATAATAQVAHRIEDRRRAQMLFTSARVASHGLTGDGAPESGQLAARELLALARIDDIDGALKGLDDVTRFSSSWQAPQLALLRAQFALGAGRVDESASAARTATELMAELHDHAFQGQLRELLAILALLRGDSPEARTQLAAATEAGTDVAMVRALIADSDGDPRGAAGVIAAIRHSGTTWPEEWIVAAVVSAHHRDDCETVRAGTELLSELADRNPDLASAVGAHQLANALSTKDYSRARDTLATSPRLLLAARADEEFGRFTLDAGDRTAAVAALDLAYDRYAELGAGAPATRVQRLLQTAGVRRRRWAAVPRRPETGWDALTGMERRVALLIADGCTNRSAAEQLVLSSSTISTHLRAVFSKLGVHSRVQLANLVQRRDG